MKFLFTCLIFLSSFTQKCSSYPGADKGSVSTEQLQDSPEDRPKALEGMENNLSQEELSVSTQKEEIQNGDPSPRMDEIQSQSYREQVKEKKYLPFHFYSEFLYFKIAEDAIKYAEKFPQDSSITPRVSEIKQDFSYSPGGRLGLGIPTALDQWELGTEWTYLYAHPSMKQSSAKEFGILASLVIPTWGAFGNNAVEHVKGNWHLTFNSVDLHLQRRFHPTPRVYISTWGGVLAGFIDQKMWVRYRDFRVDFTEVTTPQKVISKEWMSSVGPYMGLNLACRLPGKIDLFFKYSFGFLGGMFSVKTKYKEFSQSPTDAHVTLKDSYTRTFTAQQMQTGISKEWSSRSCEFSLALGWEFQQWTHQMHMRWFSSFTQAQDPADLSFYGPFFRMYLRF
jgi:hypothetical protein